MKKILGLVIWLVVVFAFGGVGKVSAQACAPGSVCAPFVTVNHLNGCKWDTVGVPHCIGTYNPGVYACSNPNTCTTDVLHVCSSNDEPTFCWPKQNEFDCTHTVIDVNLCSPSGCCVLPSATPTPTNAQNSPTPTPGPTSTPSPTPDPTLTSAWVQGRYRLEPGGLAVNENDSRFSPNLRVTLNQYIQGNDFVTPFDITQGGAYGLSFDKYTSKDNPLISWRLFSIPPTTWSVSSNVPSGYSVGYTLCYNNTNCHVVPTNQPIPNKGTIVTMDQQMMYNTRNVTTNTAYADLYWHYCKDNTPVPGLRVTPAFECGQTGDQVIMWDSLAGSITYRLRVDDTSNGFNLTADGRCGTMNPGDYCWDDIPATISPSKVIPGGLKANKTYKIWVSAINQCGGGAGTKTEIVHRLDCPSPTPTPVAPVCQNLTLWKNNQKLTEPYTGKINLHDRITYRMVVSSLRPITQIVYSVTKGGSTSVMSVPVYCRGRVTSTNYVSDLTLDQDLNGDYDIHYIGVGYDAVRCIPGVTLEPVPSMPI